MISQVVYLVLICFMKFCSSEFVNITSDVFIAPIQSLPVSFGDLNDDKLTDIFVISQRGRAVDVLVPSEDKFTQVFVFKPTTLIQPEHNESRRIVNVVPADFDGDLQLDLLIVRKEDGKAGVKVKLYWGNGQNVFKNDGNVIHMADQPLMMDYDADLVPDLFGESEPGKRFYWNIRHRNITKVPVRTNNNFPPLQIPNSNAFLDLNEDYEADLIVASNKNASSQFEIWDNVNGTLKLTRNVSLPPDVDLKVKGQLTFLDIDADGLVDYLLPGCTDIACSSSFLYLYSNQKWQSLPVKLTREGVTWSFTPPGKNVDQDWLHPVQLWVGDYNQDSYPDALTVLYTMDGDRKIRHQVVLLENIACSPGTKGCPTVGRTLQVMWETALNKTVNPVLATFYDIAEDGTLDILVVTKTENTFSVQAFRNDYAKDSCFLKALVLSGLCKESSGCGYGLTNPGAAVCYNTTTLEGKAEKSCGAQQPSSSYFALQLPYVNFGLGSTPNFVDKLMVGIPNPPGKSIRSHQWTLIIPNSQLVVFPYPPDDPHQWKNKLFVTPSRLVLITGAVLLGTCGFIALIVGLLHWKERREDRMEKRQDAHKFHFDAM